MRNFILIALAGVASALKITEATKKQEINACKASVEVARIYNNLDVDGNGLAWNEFDVLIQMGLKGEHINQEQANEMNAWYHWKTRDNMMDVAMCHEGLNLIMNEMLKVPAEHQCEVLQQIADGLTPSTECFDMEAEHVIKALDTDNNGIDKHEFEQLVGFGLEIGEINNDQAIEMTGWWNEKSISGKVDTDMAKEGLHALMDMLAVPDHEKCMVLRYISENVRGMENNVPDEPTGECFSHAINFLVYTLDINNNGDVCQKEMQKFIDANVEDNDVSAEEAAKVQGWFGEHQDANGNVQHQDIHELVEMLLKDDEVPQEHWCDAIFDVAAAHNDVTCFPKAFNNFFAVMDYNGDESLDSGEFGHWMGNLQMIESVPQGYVEEATEYFKKESGENNKLQKCGARRGLKHVLKKFGVPKNEWCHAVNDLASAMAAYIA